MVVSARVQQLCMYLLELINGYADLKFPFIYLFVLPPKF